MRRPVIATLIAMPTSVALTIMFELNIPQAFVVGLAIGSLAVVIAIMTER